MKKMINPRKSKFLGITLLTAGIVCVFFWPTLGVAYFMMIYGGLCLAIPHKLMPSQDEIAARNSALRKKVVASRDEQIEWYLSPVPIGLIIFLLLGLQYVFI